MLFKLFTLFSMVVLTQGASVREIGPSYVTRRHHHYGGNVGGGGSGGWGGSGGGSGGCGGWQDLLSGQTVTVTVTETPVYSTSTDEPIVTDDSVSTTDGESVSTTDGGSGDDSADLNSQEHCLYLFNEMRKSQNLPLFESATQEQIDCADNAAAYDAQAGYHASFYNQMCNLGGQGGSPASQCACMKNVGLYDLPNADPNDPLKNCINAYIAEYTLGFYPQENLGHWKIITGNFRSVACGTDGNGFYVHNFYT